jgi:hypothetical protein
LSKVAPVQRQFDKFPAGYHVADLIRTRLDQRRDSGNCDQVPALRNSERHIQPNTLRHINLNALAFGDSESPRFDGQIVRACR